MFYLDFLQGLHERLLPRTYLEIGVAHGHSLALSRCRSIGIDPAFEVDQELAAPVSLIRCTSDAYFAQLAQEGTKPFGELPIDLAFIDGMHHFERALRDFIGIERHSAPSTVVAFDDVFPRDVDEATRVPRALSWAGDVFRVQFALAAHRPDLLQVSVDTEPTGTLLVVRLDATNHVLAEQFDDIVREYVMPDPQPVPPAILARHHAMAPESALALPLWDELREARGGSGGRGLGVRSRQKSP
jgi:hypothetical protein